MLKKRTPFRVIGLLCVFLSFLSFMLIAQPGVQVKVLPIDDDEDPGDGVPPCGVYPGDSTFQYFQEQIAANDTIAQ